jgi:hypothetical protein
MPGVTLSPPGVQQFVEGRGNFQAAKEGWLKLCASYPNLSGSDYAVAIALSTYFNSKTRDACHHSKGWPRILTATDQLSGAH